MLIHASYVTEAHVSPVRMVASIYVDLVITFQDWAFDLNAVYIFAV